MHDEWRILHKNIMSSFLEFINNKDQKSFILKGGTALLFCYNLNRFSEDLDFDGISNIIPVCQEYCKKHGYTCFVKKDTDSTKRCTIHYETSENNDLHPLKVECSYRKKNFDGVNTTIINEVRTYPINTLFIQKANAYMGRNKLRDIYDVTFIINNYFDRLSKDNKDLAVNIFSEKGLDHFDNVVSMEEDHLIDKEKLGNDFLDAFDSLGLIPVRDDNEHQQGQNEQHDKEHITAR